MVGGLELVLVLGIQSDDAEVSFSLLEQGCPG